MQRQPKAKRPAARAGKPDRRCATKKPRAGKTSGPQTAQQTLPYREMYKDGICRVDGRLYTKSIDKKRVDPVIKGSALFCSQKDMLVK